MRSSRYRQYLHNEGFGAIWPFFPDQSQAIAILFIFLPHLAEPVTLARLLLAVTFASLILSSTALSQPTDRTETGTYFRDMQRDGYGLLAIHNNWTMDTVAVLTDRNLKPLLVVYLRSRESIEIKGINDGDYELYFTIGDQWDG